MSQRIVVSPQCSPPCPACVSCRPDGRQASLEQVLVHREVPELILGGGDATRWTHLTTYLGQNARSETPQRLWLEAPARAFTTPVLEALQRRGAYGVFVQIEATGAAMLRALGAADGEKVLADAQALGLKTQVRLVVRPKTLPSLAALAARIAPTLTWLELQRQDWGGEPVTMWPGPIGRLLLTSQNVNFSSHRRTDRGHLPPCVLPAVWSTRPTAFRALLSPRAEPNQALPACARCALSKMCPFDEPEGLSEETKADAVPVDSPVLPWDRPRILEQEVPTVITRRRPSTDVVCVTPWTTMEIVDPDGRVRQCCSTWTVGDRGNVVGNTLAAVWNGTGYQEARRIMSGEHLESLCIPLCSRLHDRKFSEKKLKIQDGSEPFVQNQLLMAEEIAERKEVIRSRPLRMAICPSTYCNYNCIMCDHGRSPRRELPESIWEELPEFMPTLRSLTLLGGEPLANPLAQRFLRDFDASRWPDASVDIVTNGSLLSAAVLARMKRCTLGDVTISVNAGTPEVYEKVQRGVPMEQLLQNIDALLEYRAQHPRWFGITLSFVVQPTASHTLIEFGELASKRNLSIRLMALNPENHEGLDFYLEPDKVARVLEDVDRFLVYVKHKRPDWLPEVLAARSAVLEEAAARMAGAPKDRSGSNPGARRLVVLT